MEEAARARACTPGEAPEIVAASASGTRTAPIQTGVAAAGIALALASAVWIVPSAWPTYAVFFALAFAFSFVWLDSDAPTSVPHMATATAFVYVAGFPVLFFELLARLVAYPVIFAAARRGVLPLPRPLRPLAQEDRRRGRSATLALAAMLGLATIGLAVRVAVIHVAHAAGMSVVHTVILGEPVAYAVMGALSAWLPLPTGDYVVAAPHRLPADDERVDVIYTAVLIVPFLVVAIVDGWLDDGLVGAAGWSLGALAPHWVVQLVIRRRHVIDERTASLTRKQDELEAFTWAMTHDVRAPVTSASVAADRMLETHRAALPEPARRELLDIARLTGKAGTMIGDLLDVVRIVSEPELVTTVDLGAIVAEAVALHAPQIAARRIRVAVTTPLPTLPGQAVKLGHVFSNLIGNAIRFVPPETGVVEVSATREDACVVVAVRDNGVGIPPKYQETIFGLFRRMPGREPDGVGSGMGLAIVKRIVEGHGGKVWAESAAGGGAAFRVRLPL